MDDAMKDKFLNDLHEDEEKQIAQVWNSIIMGKNKKRLRGQFDFDDLDENTKKKLKRIEERAQKLEDFEFDADF